MPPQRPLVISFKGVFLLHSLVSIQYLLTRTHKAGSIPSHTASSAVLCRGISTVMSSPIARARWMTALAILPAEVPVFSGHVGNGFRFFFPWWGVGVRGLFVVLGGCAIPPARLILSPRLAGRFHRKRLDRRCQSFHLAGRW